MNCRDIWCRACKSVIYIGVFLFLLMGAIACSQYSNKPGSVAFHNLSANYNAYFLAKVKLDSAEQKIAQEYKENYNLMLPILIPLDSNLAVSSREFLKDVAQKASIVAEKHQNSKWLDNSYVVLGKARLLMGQWNEGIEALRYVFSKGESDEEKNEALIALLRVYTEKGDVSNALSVSEYLREQALTKEQTIRFYLTKAYFHQKGEEYLTSLAILEQVLPLMSKSPAKARVHYISGQLYDKLNQLKVANTHYDRVSKNKPLYDLAFYAQMNSLQNASMLDAGSALALDGFKKMLKDRKNIDLKDKIYYTMGVLSEAKNDYPSAISNFQSSVKNSVGSTKQVPYTYLEIARIHLDHLNKPDIAKMYFDSAMAILPATDPSYKVVAERKQSLDEFVAQQIIIKTEDSLQTLASLGEAARKAQIETVIERQQDVQQLLFEKEQAELEKLKNTPKSPSATPAAGPRWFLYDPSLITQGKTEFSRKWGNRTLGDDWRRQNKPAPLNQTIANEAGGVMDNAAAKPIFVRITKDSPEWDAKYADLLRNIPLSDSALAVSHHRKEEALYGLGKIYRTTFKQQDKSIETFSRLLNEYPKSEYKQEVYYLLYLSYGADDAQRLVWKKKLEEEYPNSIYVRFLSDVAVAGSGKTAKESYEQAFALYDTKNYTKALETVDNGIAIFRNDKAVDRLALLRLFIVGKLQGAEAYRTAILEFMRLYPESEYLPRTKEMLTAAEKASLLPRN